MSSESAILEGRLAQLEERCAASEATCAQLKRRLRAACGMAFASLMVALFASPTTRAAAQAGYGATLQSLINKTQFISVDANGEMHITGTNLHLENGLGATNGDPSNPQFGGVTNGKGNLIIGYNLSKVPIGGTDNRTGSHNLVLGDLNDYSSYGGIVAGDRNTISGAYASVTGGLLNAASFNFASVSGGQLNTASGFGASVSGGRQNTASEPYASVSGGELNTASGPFASVSGGNGVVQPNNSGWAAGGNYFPGTGPGVFHAP
jgi:hypothetical protein